MKRSFGTVALLCVTILWCGGCSSRKDETPKTPEPEKTTKKAEPVKKAEPEKKTEAPKEEKKAAPPETPKAPEPKVEKPKSPEQIDIEKLQLGWAIYGNLELSRAKMQLTFAAQELKKAGKDGPVKEILKLHEKAPFKADARDVDMDAVYQKCRSVSKAIASDSSEEAVSARAKIDAASQSYLAIVRAEGATPGLASS